ESAFCFRTVFFFGARDGTDAARFFAAMKAFLPPFSWSFTVLYGRAQRSPSGPGHRSGKKTRGDGMALCSLAIAAGVIGAVAVVKRLVFWRRFGGYGYGGLAACGPGLAGYGGGCGSARWGWGGPRAWRRSGGAWGGYGHGPGGSFWLRGLF